MGCNGGYGKAHLFILGKETTRDLRAKNMFMVEVRKIMVKLTCLTLLFSVSTVLPVQAGPDLMQVHELAKTNDPAYGRAEYLNQAVVETKRQALAGFLPSLMAEAEYVDTSQDIVSSDNTVFDSGTSDYDSTTYTISLIQPVFNYATWMRYDQSKAELAQSNMEFEMGKQDLVIMNEWFSNSGT